VEEIGRPTFIRCGERLPRLRILQLDTTVVSGAMCEQQPSTRFVKQGDRILVRVGLVEATVDLAQNLSVLEHQAFRAQPFVDHGKATVARCRRCIKAIGVADRGALFSDVECERTAAAHPIDQAVAAPTKGADAGCREAVLPERSHRAS
jgi:hypothetical protein